jgi:hypothetical protein
MNDYIVEGIAHRLWPQKAQFCKNCDAGACGSAQGVMRRHTPISIEKLV